MSGGANRTGARRIAHGAEAHGLRERRFARGALHERRYPVEHAVALEHLTLVREVDVRHAKVARGEWVRVMYRDST